MIDIGRDGKIKYFATICVAKGICDHKWSRIAIKNEFEWIGYELLNNSFIGLIFGKNGDLESYIKKCEIGILIKWYSISIGKATERWKK